MKRTLEEILNDFSKPINPKYISKKPTFNKGNKSGEVDYIAWPTMCRLLNEFTRGYWDWKVRTQFLGDRVVIEGSLTIHGSDGSLTREATGNELSETSGYGDPSSNAEAMALRRCAAKFGLGLSLWEKTTNSYQPRVKGEISKDEWLKRQQEKSAIASHTKETILTN